MGPVGTEPEDLRERTPGETTARTLLQALPATVPAQGRWARLVGRDPLAPVNRAHHEQVLAERRVGRLLGELDRRWQVLHGVPVAVGESVHHLLVGPGGVVLVRTCTQPGVVVPMSGGTVPAAGRPSSALHAARSQARAVAEELARSRDVRVPVHALVVVVGARRLAGVPRGATVLRDRDLLHWLRDRPAVLSSVEVERLCGAAARASTWPGHAAEADAAVTVDATVAGRWDDQPARERRGRRRHERLRLDDWSTAVTEAARMRLVGRLALVLGACSAAAALVVSVVGSA